MREAVADSLTAVKDERDATDAQLAHVLVKSADQARAYRLGEADMTATTFWRGVREWGASFGNAAAALAGYRLCELEPVLRNDRSAPRRLTALLMGVSVAIESNDDIDDAELLANAPAIHDAGALLDELRQRLASLSRAA